VEFKYAIPHSEGFPLGPAGFARGAAVGEVFPFSALSSLYFLQNGPYALVVQFFRSQSRWIPDGCGYRCNSSYMLGQEPLNTEAEEAELLEPLPGND
jgi:hypothetical protein